jgi:hypothetical protein
MSELIESSYIVFVLSLKWDTFETQVYKTTKEFLAALKNEQNLDSIASSDDDDSGDDYDIIDDDDLDEIISQCVEHGHELIFNGASTGWASVIRAVDGKTWGSSGNRNDKRWM